MSQYDFGTIDPYTDDGVTLADMLNNWRDAVHSWHRGAARPSYAVPGMAWINDTGGPTNWLVMVYLGPSVGDLVLFTYDTTTGVIIASAAILLAQSATNPSLRWNATGNAADVKAWRATVPVGGTLRFGAYNDAGVEVGAITFNRDGKLIADLSLATGLPPQGVFIGTAPPGSPLVGQQWWKSDDGVMYLRYDDGNTVQWVPAAPQQSTRANFRTYDEYTANAGLNATIPNTDAVPLATAGTNILSRAITVAAGQRVRARFQGEFAMASAATMTTILTRTGSANALRCVGVTSASADYATPVLLEYEDAPAPGTYTYGINVGTNGPGFRFNGSSSGRWYGGTSAATLTLEVYTP